MANFYEVFPEGKAVLLVIHIKSALSLAQRRNSF